MALKEAAGEGLKESEKNVGGNRKAVSFAVEENLATLSLEVIWTTEMYLMT